MNIILVLNRTGDAGSEHGEPVTAPGVPPGHPNPQTLAAANCIRPPAIS